MSATSETDWDRFVLAQPQASFFHRSAWRHVAARVFGHRPHFLSLGEGAAMRAVLPLIEVKSALFGHALVSNAFCVGGSR